MRDACAAVIVALGVLGAGACGPPNVAGDPLKATSTGEAFAGVQCSAVRPQTEPDLMAWDPGSRSNLNRLRRQGVVAVRYQAKGCNVELELLSNCIGSAGKYDFSPYSANERKVAHNANELFAQLPVGAARLSGSVKGNRALRTDYMMAGQYALPAGSTFRVSDLRGPDCSRATHVVSAVYVGAFAMGAGESRTIEGSATLLGAGAGGKSTGAVEVLGDEGDADACRASQKEAKESERCAVPLRVGLLELDGSSAPPIASTPPSTSATTKSESTPAVVAPSSPAPVPQSNASQSSSFDEGAFRNALDVNAGDMTPDGPPTVADLVPGGTTTTNVTLTKGRCYRVVALSSLGIELKLANHIAYAGGGRAAVIGRRDSPVPFCQYGPTEVGQLELRAPSGGTVKAQVFSKKR